MNGVEFSCRFPFSKGEPPYFIHRNDLLLKFISLVDLWSRSISTEKCHVGKEDEEIRTRALSWFADLADAGVVVFGFESGSTSDECRNSFELPLDGGLLGERADQFFRNVLFFTTYASRIKLGPIRYLLPDKNAHIQHLVELVEIARSRDSIPHSVTFYTDQFLQSDLPEDKSGPPPEVTVKSPV